MAEFDYSTEFAMDEWKNDGVDGEKPAISAENLNKITAGINESLELTKNLGAYLTNYADTNIKYIHIVTKDTNAQKSVIGKVSNWDKTKVNNYICMLHTTYNSMNNGTVSDSAFFEIGSGGRVYVTATSWVKVYVDIEGTISVSSNNGGNVDLLLFPCNKQSFSMS